MAFNVTVSTIVTALACLLQAPDTMFNTKSHRLSSLGYATSECQLDAVGLFLNRMNEIEQQYINLRKRTRALEDVVQRRDRTIKHLQMEIAALEERAKNSLPSDCENQPEGRTQIQVNYYSEPFEVSCQTVNRTTWTLIAWSRGLRPSESYTLQDYENGFGNVTECPNFIGLENLHTITSNRVQELAVYFAFGSVLVTEHFHVYRKFRVESKAKEFRLYYEDVPSSVIGPDSSFG